MKKPPVVNDDICFCPLSGVLDVIAKKWALLIVAILGNEGEKGFNELKKDLGCISPKPLSDTLKNLERIGLVSKKVLETSPPTVKYSLTSDGRELREHLIPMLVWVSERGGQDMPGCPIRARNTSPATRETSEGR
ncbi:MAG: helix-turn-helix domain-containing protein [Methanoculleus sp.]|uniref:winged helix-turn-helix transcriptional regulator n=1 Tax=Methanoculleus sp. TaxID=90427 RepID=UPI0026029059|nr:helix-turn-helix domain-containing protein [Methanoculleus sp.]MDD2254797.1 helix-turn-helix domain-containing protein [Methanoculleus sp.]MDD4471716.1 helix-turn-helix domain-containing protein [Methanoculleus sp.]